MSAEPKDQPGSAGEVLWVFFRLGLTSFGGPVAHLGFFRDAFVVRRAWLTDQRYADLVAVCQFLPGPTSSQVGMAIGRQRAGYLGMAAAWAGFTLPSAAVLMAFAYGVTTLGDVSDASWLQGLKAAALAVVVHAIIGMARSLTPDAARALIAAAAAGAVLLVPGALAQMGVIAAAGAIGVLLLGERVDTGAEIDDGDDRSTPTSGASRRGAMVALGLFVALLGAVPVASRLFGGDAIGLIGVMYRAGALVFGGGHVVLSLLQADLVTPGLIDGDLFLAGYGVAQGVPGPLFTFSAYLGAVSHAGPGGMLGAIIAVVAIFVPAALLVIGVLPFWERLRSASWARAMLRAVNAAVVGLLLAALIESVRSETITAEFTGVAGGAFALLITRRLPPWAVVIGAGFLGAVVL